MKNYANFVYFTFYTAIVIKILCTKIPGDPNMQIFSVGRFIFFEIHDLRKVFTTFISMECKFCLYYFNFKIQSATYLDSPEFSFLGCNIVIYFKVV